MTISYGSFEEGIKRFVYGLNLEEVQIKKDKTETPEVGVDYLAEIKAKMKKDFFFGGGEIAITFHVTSDTDSENIEKWDSLTYVASIYIGGVTDFHKSDHYYEGEDPPEIWAWAAEVVEEFNEKRMKDRIGFMFGDSPIVVLPPEPTYIEATLRGLVACGEKELLIFKIRHVDGGFEHFSYAIRRGDWFVFPNVGATVSGSGRYIKQIDAVIGELESKIKIQIIEFDVDYKEFEEKLLNENRSRKENFFEELFDMAKRKKLPNDIQSEYNLEIQEISADIKNGKPIRAMRGLRALIEDSAKYLCKLKGISLPVKPTKKHIIPPLIEKKILEPRLMSWFDAFYSIADKASHSVSLEELNILEKQFFVHQTIVIGGLLCLEILSKIEEFSSTA